MRTAMQTRAMNVVAATLVAALSISGAAYAQSGDGADTDLTASPFGTAKIDEQEVAALTMPALDLNENAADAANYDKYFYFRRADTDVATAFADISECDGYARGLASAYSGADVPYPYTYTIAGAVGGALGNALAGAIYGSSQKRLIRRVNMRQCMGYKGYQRHGISKDSWLLFHFEEGSGEIAGEERQRALKLQALVAARAPATGKVLAP